MDTYRGLRPVGADPHLHYNTERETMRAEREETASQWCIHHPSVHTQFCLYGNIAGPPPAISRTLPYKQKLKGRSSSLCAQHELTNLRWSFMSLTDNVLKSKDPHFCRHVIFNRLQLSGQLATSSVLLSVCKLDNKEWESWGGLLCRSCSLARCDRLLYTVVTLQLCILGVLFQFTSVLIVQACPHNDGN